MMVMVMSADVHMLTSPGPPVICNCSKGVFNPSDCARGERVRGRVRGRGRSGDTGTRPADAMLSRLPSREHCVSLREREHCVCRPRVACPCRQGVMLSTASSQTSWFF